MKRLSITARVTLLYTLFMVLLAGVALGFLFHAGAQSARQDTLNRMQRMVEDSRQEIEAEDGILDFDRDLESFDDGVYLSVYDTAGIPLFGLVPREFDNSAVFADKELRTVESYGRSWYLYDDRLPWKNTVRCGYAASRRPMRWMPPWADCSTRHCWCCRCLWCWRR